jgi:hypothetical protein
MVGLANASQGLTVWLGSGGNGIGWESNGNVFGPNGGSFNLITTVTGFTTGDVLGMELLSTTAKAYKNGTLIYTFTTLPSGSLFPGYSLYHNGNNGTANFGASALSFLPSGDASWDGVVATPFIFPRSRHYVRR